MPAKSNNSSNPFAGPGEWEAIDADSRIRAVASFTREECMAAQAMGGKLQRTVQLAVERRLRKLQRERIYESKAAKYGAV